MSKKKEEKSPLDLEALNVTFNEIVKAIVEINKGMQALTKSRVRMDAIITLLERSTKLPRTHIRIVLDNLQSIESLVLKAE